LTNDDPIKRRKSAAIEDFFSGITRAIHAPFHPDVSFPNKHLSWNGKYSILSFNELDHCVTNLSPAQNLAQTKKRR